MGDMTVGAMGPKPAGVGFAQRSVGQGVGRTFMFDSSKQLTRLGEPSRPVLKKPDDLFCAVH